MADPQPRRTIFLMKRLVNPQNIVGANEIAKRLGRAHSTIVHSWHRRLKDFPQPIVVLKAGKLWDWEEVKEWAKKTKRIK
jgi:predicted DNA-binding transcriptional regulator AlpA